MTLSRSEEIALHALRSWGDMLAESIEDPAMKTEENAEDLRALEAESALTEELIQKYERWAADDESRDDRIAERPREFGPDMVPSSWKMDPKEDAFLPDGTHLRPGMRIIASGEILCRTALRPRMNQWDWERARKENTWVTLVNVSRSHGNYDVLRLHVRYDDGEETNWSYNQSFGWIVKRDSISTDTDRTE